MTREQRLEDYKLALKRLKEGYVQKGFCRLLPQKLNKENYPELFKYKPWTIKIERLQFFPYYSGFKSRRFFGYNLHPFGCFWFDPENDIKRIQILENIIQKMEIINVF